MEGFRNCPEPLRKWKPWDCDPSSQCGASALNVGTALFTSKQNPLPRSVSLDAPDPCPLLLALGFHD